MWDNDSSSGGQTRLSKYFLLTQDERVNPVSSPVIMGKLGPPLLAGEPALCGQDLSPVVFSFTHDALPDIDFTGENNQLNISHIGHRSLHLCM